MIAIATAIVTAIVIIIWCYLDSDCHDDDDEEEDEYDEYCWLLELQYYHCFFIVTIIRCMITVITTVLW